MSEDSDTIALRSSDRVDIKGPVILWRYSDGWQPESFPSVEKAMQAEIYGAWIITRPVYVEERMP